MLTYQQVLADWATSCGITVYYQTALVSDVLLQEKKASWYSPSLSTLKTGLKKLVFHDRRIDNRRKEKINHVESEAVTTLVYSEMESIFEVNVWLKHKERRVVREWGNRILTKWAEGCKGHVSKQKHVSTAKKDINFSVVILQHTKQFEVLKVHPTTPS